MYLYLDLRWCHANSVLDRLISGITQGAFFYLGSNFKAISRFLTSAAVDKVHRRYLSADLRLGFF